jgi:hypothetical protein
MVYMPPEFDALRRAAPRCISRALRRSLVLCIPDMGNRRFVILSTLLVGCSSAGSGVATGTDTPAALAASLANSFCAAEASCCGTAGGTTADGGATVSCVSDAGVAPGLASTCLERATLAANQQLALVSTAFSEGLLTIDPTVSAACTAAYKTSLTCTTLGSGPDVQAAIDDPLCAGLFIGYIPVNERCDMSAECISGSYCLSQGTGMPATSIAGSGTLGICFAYEQAGDPCNTSDDCLPPLGCNAVTLTCG